MTPDPPEPPSTRRLLATVGAGLLLVVCCATPALVAGGALGVAGGALRSRWLIAAAVLVVLAAACGSGCPASGRGRSANTTRLASARLSRADRSACWMCRCTGPPVARVSSAASSSSTMLAKLADSTGHGEHPA